MRYSKIDKIECCNGEGFGVSVFVQGCHFRCPGCFNPETWDFDGGEEWGRGQVDLVLKLLENPHCTRLSILGGEPLADENVFEVHELIREVKKKFGKSKKIWLYTGYNFVDIMGQNREVKHWFVRSLTAYICDYIVDGRFNEDKKDLSLAFRGSSNQQIIDVKATNKKAKGYFYDSKNIVLKDVENG